jgi:hypothetical protein
MHDRKHLLVKQTFYWVYPSCARYKSAAPLQDALENLFLATSQEPTAVKLPLSLAQEFPCAQIDLRQAESHFD